MAQGYARKMVDRCLWIYTLLLVSLTGIAWSTYWAQGSLEIARPIYSGSDRFRDLLNYTDKISHIQKGAAALGSGLPVFNYPAPAAYLYAFFLRGFPNHPIRVFLMILVGGLIVGSVLLWRAANDSPRINWGLAAAIVSTAALSSPVWFTADRANIEGIVAVVLGTGLVFFLMRRNYAAAVFIGLAASLKPFPGVFLLLLLRRKRYWEFLTGVATFGLTVLLALTALDRNPIAAYRGLRPGIGIYYDVYLSGNRPGFERRFLHSVTDTLKVLTDSWASASPEHMHVVLSIGALLGVIAFALVVLRVFRMPTVNQLIMLGIVISLFTPSASEYTLLALYVPFGAFLVFLTKDVGPRQVFFKRAHTLLLLILFALLFSPMTFLGVYSGVSKTILLICLLTAVTSLQMPSHIFDQDILRRPTDLTGSLRLEPAP